MWLLLGGPGLLLALVGVMLPNVVLDLNGHALLSDAVACRFSELHNWKWRHFEGEHHFYLGRS